MSKPTEITCQYIYTDEKIALYLAKALIECKEAFSMEFRGKKFILHPFFCSGAMLIELEQHPDIFQKA